MTVVCEYKVKIGFERGLKNYLAAWARGDPHLVTLDGLSYTFNGRGEFTLVETSDGRFTLQGRMVDVLNENGTATMATVFSAVVAQEGDSDIVQFEVSENDTVIALINGQVIDSRICSQQFNNVTILQIGNGIVSALFSSGATIQAHVENGIMSTVMCSLPESYRAIGTQGLLGSFNGDTSDDLMPRLGNMALPTGSNIEDIHEVFGLTCKLAFSWMSCR